MRAAKRLVVAGIISVLALGIAPGAAQSVVGGKVTTNVAVPCCRS
jgi:hypothetical protein